MKSQKTITKRDYEIFEEKCGETFDKCYKRMRPKMLWWAVKIIKDDDTAQDIVDETFIKMLESIDKYEPMYRLESWIYTIVSNLSKSYLRDRKREQCVSIETQVGVDYNNSPMLLKDKLKQVVETDMDSHDRIVQEKWNIVVDCIGSLDDKYREILTLREIQRMSYEQIYAELGMNENTIKSRIRQGRILVAKMTRSRLQELDAMDTRHEFNWTM